MWCQHNTREVNTEKVYCTSAVSILANQLYLLLYLATICTVHLLQARAHCVSKSKFVQEDVCN